MNDDEAKQKIITDPDFVFSKRHDYSLKSLEERYPDECPDNVIANVLMMSEEEVADLYGQVVQKLRSNMGVESD